MFMNEPTAAEYAAYDARNAIEKNKALEERVSRLEELVGSLIVNAYGIHPDKAHQIVKG